MITRFAPSLTGYLHLGHVLHMLYVWGVAHVRGAKVVSRIEDHDLARRRPEYEAAILDAMQWLGFVPDEGLTVASASGPSRYRQSDCGDYYESMLGLLERQGLVYGCECSRSQIREGSSCPPSADGDASGIPDELCYAGTCSGKGLPLEGNTVRFRVTDAEVEFHDLKLGACRQIPKQQCGDFSLRDRRGQWTYQFACVCDDIRMGVDLVVRGEDLLSSTGRQIQLFHALKAPEPAYFHHPLICDDQGLKLSKRQRSESISSMQDAGMSAESIIGMAACAGGLVDHPDSISLHTALSLITSDNCI